MFKIQCLIPTIHGHKQINLSLIETDIDFRRVVTHEVCFLGQYEVIQVNTLFKN